jgi:hypothetical protein
MGAMRLRAGRGFAGGLALAWLSTVACSDEASEPDDAMPAASDGAIGDAGVAPDGSAIDTVVTTDAATDDTDVIVPSDVAADSMPAGDTPPVSCMYADENNPNKAEVNFSVTEASADANVTAKSYNGEARVLGTYNRTLRLLSWAFAVPFGPTPMPPCIRGSFAGSIDSEPGTAKTFTLTPGLLDPVTFLDNPTCSPLVAMTNSWSLAGPGTMTFTRVDGGNVELSFDFHMGGKYGGMAAGTFTFSGTIKSPCYFLTGM